VFETGGNHVVDEQLHQVKRTCW